MIWICRINCKVQEHIFKLSKEVNHTRDVRIVMERIKITHEAREHIRVISWYTLRVMNSRMNLGITIKELLGTT